MADDTLHLFQIHIFTLFKGHCFQIQISVYDSFLTFVLQFSHQIQSKWLTYCSSSAVWIFEKIWLTFALVQGTFRHHWIDSLTNHYLFYKQFSFFSSARSSSVYLHFSSFLCISLPLSAFLFLSTPLFALVSEYLMLSWYFEKGRLAE